MTQLVLSARGLFDFAVFKKIFINAYRAYKKNQYVKNTIAELSVLSDAELRDIGISRGDIYSIAMETYYDNLDGGRK